VQRNRIVYCRRSGRGEVIHSPYHGRFAQLLLDSAELLLEGMAPPGAVSAGLKVLHLDLAYCNRPLPDAPAESPGSQLVYLDEGATDDEVCVFELRDRKSTPEAKSATGSCRQSCVRRSEGCRPCYAVYWRCGTSESCRRKEVAGQIGISIVAAKSRLMRARVELRWRPERHLDIVPASCHFNSATTWRERAANPSSFMGASCRQRTTPRGSSRIK